MKKIDTQNTYKIRFKDEESRKCAWNHIQCMLVKIQEQTRPGRAEITIEERMKNIHDTAGRVYQLMTLYNEILQLGWAYGGFLAACYEGDKDFFKYIDYEPMTEEEIEERWDEKPVFDENPVHCTTYVINQELHDYFERHRCIKEVETPPDFLSDETRQQYINSIEEAKGRQRKRWANIMRYIEGGGR